MFGRLLRRLYAADVLTMAFSAGLALLALLFAARLPQWPVVAALSLGIVIGLALLAAADAGRSSATLDFLHAWAFAPIAYVIYLEMHLVAGPLNRGWIADAALMAADRRLFGVDVGVWLAPLARPWLTEILQLAYTSFYALMVAVGAELFVRRDRPRFHLYAFSCALGFLMSFVGYMLVPAVGPRFTLFAPGSTTRDLPGLVLTPVLRAFVDGGGMVPAGLPAAAVLAAAPRDVFPSGHTMMTLVAMYWSWRFRLRIRYLVTLVGALIIAATVYLRYHYAVDLLAGAALALCCAAASPRLYTLTTKHTKVTKTNEEIPPHLRM